MLKDTIDTENKYSIFKDFDLSLNKWFDLTLLDNHTTQSKH